MFLSNVRTALIVAINIPLALLFAFSVLYFLRGKSANLLSIGAVDFGIIVDSSVIIAENIYRHLASGEARRSPAEDPHLPRGGRNRPCLAVFHADHGLRVHSTVYDGGSGGGLVRPDGADLRLGVGRGPGPGGDADPRACACCCFKNLKPAPDNFLVRFIKTSYLRQLDRCLKHRWLTVLFFAHAVRRHGLPAAVVGSASSCRNWRKATSGFATRPR